MKIQIFLTDDMDRVLVDKETTLERTGKTYELPDNFSFTKLINEAVKQEKELKGTYPQLDL